MFVHSVQACRSWVCMMLTMIDADISRILRMGISTYTPEDVEKIFEKVNDVINPQGAGGEGEEQDSPTDADSNRYQRRQKSASEILKFDRKNKLGVAPPRTLVEIGQALMQKPLIWDGLTVEHKVQVDMLCKEYDNYFGHTTKCRAGRNNALLYQVKCTEENCEGGCCASFLMSSLHWKFNNVTPHTAECVKKAQARVRPDPEEGAEELRSSKEHSITPYTYQDLALVTALQQVANDDISVPAKKLQSHLALLIHGSLQDSKIFKLRHELQKQLIGTATQAAREFPALMTILENDGHTVDVKIVEKSSMQAIILKQRQAQFESQQTKLSPAQRRRWADVLPEETEKAAELLARDEPNTKYLVGWSIIFRTGQAMIPHLTNVFMTDATFMRSKIGGALYCTVAPDANNGIVVMSVSWHWGGENSMGWRAHAELLCRIIPEGARFIMDGNAAAIAAFETYLRDGKIFMCSVHFAKNIGKAIVKRFYHNALNTPTQALLDALKSTISVEDFNSLISKHRPERLFMQECGQLHGHHCQSSAESFNKTILECRKTCNHIGEPTYFTYMCIRDTRTYTHTHTHRMQ